MRAWAAVGVMVSLLAAPTAWASPAPPAAGVKVGKAAPAFALTDLAGRKHTVTEFRGRPVALFFVCGCAPCHAFARIWGQASPGENAASVFVFLGNAAAARTFAAETGLKTPGVVLLTDPQERAAQSYGVVLCPRAFVVDAAGRLVYTNVETGPALAAPVLASRVATALRR